MNNILEWLFKETMTDLSFILSCIVILYMPYVFFETRRQLHMMQLNSYRNLRYWRWIKNNFLKNVFTKSFTIFSFFSVFCLILIYFMPSEYYEITLRAYLFGGLVLFGFNKKSPEKKPLVFTARLNRLASIIWLIQLFFYIKLFMFTKHLSVNFSNDNAENYVHLVILSFLLSVLLLPIIMLTVNLILLPFETAINKYYFNDAKRKLHAHDHLKVIGITGSYGKTTTKFALGKILQHKYHTLVPQGSFNTPMGIAKVIRTRLQAMHEVFVAELSAKQKGDIRELCELTQPKMGILTAIGPQHLETFGSLETIKSTKNELIECLPKNGIAFFNMDDEHCRDLAKLTKKKSFYYGLYHDYLHYKAYNISINGDGCSFDVVHYDDYGNPLSKPVTFTTKLLGQHNVYNILGAIAVSSQMGIALEEMVYPIKQLKPIEHRLELKQGFKNTIFIDDAFNSNPVGSKMALEILHKISGNRKIIVTPGMVELGKKEFELNQQFGKYIAETCDYVILVGKKQSEAIIAGLQEVNYPEKQIFVAKHFNEANQHLQSILQEHDVVLFENDLPDSY